MSLSQCFMSSIVTVSFLCQERNNRAIFPLALPKWVLAPGLGAALAAVRRVCFRDMGGFMMLCTWSQTQVLGKHMSLELKSVPCRWTFLVLEAHSFGSWGRFCQFTSPDYLQRPCVALWDSLLLAGWTLGLKDTSVYRPDWPLEIEFGCPKICPRLQEHLGSKV